MNGLLRMQMKKGRVVVVVFSWVLDGDEDEDDNAVTEDVYWTPAIFLRGASFPTSNTILSSIFRNLNLLIGIK